MTKRTLEVKPNVIKLSPMNVVSRLAAMALLSLCWSVCAAEARIVKTLPHFLDKTGRHAVHPSLFERDGYQAHLRAHPELCSGMRFDIQWKGSKLREPQLKLEVRGAKTPARQAETFSRKLEKGAAFSRWAGISVSGSDFARLGSIVAWRVSIWDGDQEVAEQKSFLW